MTSPNTLHLDAIVASTTNPRKHFDKAALQELAESIAKHGILQAILVRPNGAGGKFELVAGERRWRAAKIAKLERIPVSVRELTDAEVLEIQVVENLQRADLHPLEEAEGYEQLMKCHHADGRTYTADEIAAKVGKSKSYVYQRLKLTSLMPKAREAFYAGRLDASRALLVARIPESLQEQALERLAPEEDDETGWVPSFREAREIIHEEFMLDLKKPPFDVKAIYFAADQANPIGTPCGECPKRTGNQPQLFDDVKSGDICTDPACFHAKAAAQSEKIAEEHRAKGHTVLTGDEARKVMPNTWSTPKKGLISPDAVLLGAPGRKSIAKLLGKKMPPLTLVEHPHNQGEFVHLVDEKAVRTALISAGHDWAKDRGTTSTHRGDVMDTGRSMEAERGAVREQTACELALHKAVREAVGRDGLTEEDLRFIVATLYSYADIDEDVGELLGLPDGETIDNFFEKVPAAQLLPALVDCALGTVWHAGDEQRAAMAKRHGVDAAAVIAQAKAAFEAKEAEEAAKSASTKETKKPAKAGKKAKVATSAEASA